MFAKLTDEQLEAQWEAQVAWLDRAGAETPAQRAILRPSGEANTNQTAFLHLTFLLAAEEELRTRGLFREEVHPDN